MRGTERGILQPCQGVRHFCSGQKKGDGRYQPPMVRLVSHIGGRARWIFFYQDRYKSSTNHGYHLPVAMTFGASTAMCRKCPPRIAWWKRKDGEILSQVGERCKKEVPKLTEKILNARLESELEEGFSTWAELMSQPFVTTKRPRPASFKEFWDNNLDRLAKERTKWYKKASRTMSQEDWAQHKRIQKEIKRLVKKKKQERFDQFKKEVEEMKPSEAQATINSIVRAKKGYAARHAAVAKTVEPDEYTAYFQAQSVPPRPVTFHKPFFDVDDEFRNLITEALRRAPNRKAPVRTW